LGEVGQERSGVLTDHGGCVNQGLGDHVAVKLYIAPRSL
jgi:hypothetical protein